MTKELSEKRIMPIRETSLRDHVDSVLQNSDNTYAAQSLFEAARMLQETGKYPSFEDLHQLELTEGSFLALMQLRSIPGGAASPAALRGIVRDIKEEDSGRPLHVLLATHGDFRPRPVPHETPGYPMMDYAQEMVHAECSCGLSGGNTQITRRKMAETVGGLAHFLQRQSDNVQVTCVETFINRSASQKNNGQVALSYSVTPMDGLSNGRFDPGRFAAHEPYRENTLSAEEFNLWLRSIMDQGQQIRGVKCVDFRQGFNERVNQPSMSPEEVVKRLGNRYRLMTNQPVSLGEELKNTGKTTVRTDWPFNAHTESLAIAMIGEGDFDATALAYYHMTHPSWALRRNYAGTFLSEAYPLLFRVSKHSVSSTSKREYVPLQQGMQAVLGGINSHVRARTPNTALIQEPYRLFMEQGAELEEIKGPDYLPLLTSDCFHNEFMCGILPTVSWQTQPFPQPRYAVPFSEVCPVLPMKDRIP